MSKSTPETDAAVADYFEAIADLLDSQQELETACKKRITDIATTNRNASKQLQTLNVVALSKKAKKAS